MTLFQLSNLAVLGQDMVFSKTGRDIVFGGCIDFFSSEAQEVGGGSSETRRSSSVQ